MPQIEVTAMADNKNFFIKDLLICLGQRRLYHHIDHVRLKILGSKLTGILKEPLKSGAKLALKPSLRQKNICFLTIKLS